MAGVVKILALAWAVAVPLAQAQTADDGRLLASGCFQCHGTAGVKGGFGSIAGIGGSAGEMAIVSASPSTRRIRVVRPALLNGGAATSSARVRASG